MRSTFSPGFVTVLFYVFVIVVSVILWITWTRWAGGDWAAQIATIIWIIAIMVMVGFGQKVRLWEQRRRQAKRDESAKFVSAGSPSPGERYVLFLRPFSSTANVRIFLKRVVTTRALPGIGVKPPPTTTWGDLETIIAEAIESIARLVALGKPGEHVGAGRIAVDDSAWKDEFRQLTENAQGILIIPSMHEGTKWELTQLLAETRLLEKTIFVMPPSTYPSSVRETRYDDLRLLSKRPDIYDSSDALMCMSAFGIPIPAFKDGFLLRIGAGRAIVADTVLWVPRRSLMRSLLNWYLGQEVLELSKAHLRNAISKLLAPAPSK
jgi:hypothetical protein